MKIAFGLVANTLFNFHFRLFNKIHLKHFVNHFLKGNTAQTVIRMNSAVRSNGEVEQKRGIAPYRLIISIHQLRQTLHVFVFRFVVEPTRTNTGVRFTRNPRVAIFQSEMQHRPRHFTIVVQQTPVGLTHITSFSTNPPQVATVATVVPNQTFRLKLTNHLVSLRPLVISGAVNLARLVGSTIPTVTTIGTIKPHLKNLIVVGQQFT